MTTTFSIFLGAPMERDSPVCSLALHALLVVLSILVLGIVFWAVVWLALGFLVSGPAIYVEGINMGWGRQSL